MARLKLILAYDGTEFSGWQVQAKKKGSVRTVQGCLEEAFALVLNQKVRVHGAGRTDAGVHALGQTAHVDVPEAKAPIPWQKALCALLPRDLTVIKARFVAPDFHARYSAKSKIYTYSLWPNSRYVPQRRNFVWAAGELDLEAMDRAAAHLLGEHDFKSFQNQGTSVKNTVRTIMDLRRTRGRFPGEVVWKVQAGGFLKQMARNIVGLLAAVGRGRFDPEEVPQILRACDRSAARYPTAPPHGLCLEKVLYR
ncbi:MAG: tRNA pseudouridine(38-40) synthase TruA [Thermodesulfobacteriota bacterium]|nr:tRNA pseudouridine(38-40) synthase TruA [Thermodesulfobacteriota bacterium]